MFKKAVLVILLLIMIILFGASCSSEDIVKSSSVGGSVLELGYEIDENMDIVSPQTNFKAGEDFYFNFFNNEPFNGNRVMVELIHSESGEVLANKEYDLDPEFNYIYDPIFFSDPGKYKVSIKVGDEVRATQEVIIED
ncbi:MAG: hypothetical protein SVV67_05845 [Bacillota bacterium]|nr:hypothetical protein [Bacillota bacterium]